ncbi:MAG: T9SS type A sorting domain-containing protein [Fibrobacterota bacterium]
MKQMLSAFTVMLFCLFAGNTMADTSNVLIGFSCWGFTSDGELEISNDGIMNFSGFSIGSGYIKLCDSLPTSRLNDIKAVFERFNFMGLNWLSSEDTCRMIAEGGVTMDYNGHHVSSDDFICSKTADYDSISNFMRAYCDSLLDSYGNPDRVWLYFSYSQSWMNYKLAVNNSGTFEFACTTGWGTDDIHKTGNFSVQKINQLKGLFNIVGTHGFYETDYGFYDLAHFYRDSSVGGAGYTVSLNGYQVNAYGDGDTWPAGLDSITNSLYRLADSIRKSNTSIQAPSDNATIHPYLSCNPNPFNPSTRLEYSLGQSGPVSLDIFNAKGEKVAQLMKGTQAAGKHTVEFKATGLASGMYVCRLTTGKTMQTRPLMLMK